MRRRWRPGRCRGGDALTRWHRRLDLSQGLERYDRLLQERSDMLEQLWQSVDVFAVADRSSAYRLGAKDRYRALGGDPA